MMLSVDAFENDALARSEWRHAASQPRPSMQTAPAVPPKQQKLTHTLHARSPWSNWQACTYRHVQAVFGQTFAHLPL